MTQALKIIGIAIVVLLFGAALSVGFFSGPREGGAPAIWEARTYNWQPTPTPISIPPDELVNLLQIQLVDVRGLPVTIEAPEAGALNIAYEGSLDSLTVFEMLSKIGGFLELNYIDLDTLTIEANGTTLETDGATVSDWYQQNISNDAMLSAIGFQ